MTAYSYDRDYEPPAPVVPVRVGSPVGDLAAVLLPALVDTGADLTVVPAAMTRQLRLSETDHVTIRAGGIEMGPASVYAAQIELDGVTEIVEVLALGEETLLGRNLLRTVVVTLDGPQGHLTITHP